MSSTENLNLVPPLIESGRFHELIKAGQTISSSFSPLDNSFSAFITYANTVRAQRCTNSISKTLSHSSQDVPSKEKETKPRTDEEQPIYFSSTDVVPSSERRLVRRSNLYLAIKPWWLCLVHHGHTYYFCSIQQPFVVSWKSFRWLVSPTTSNNDTD